MSDKPLGRLLLEGLGEIAWIAVLVALGVLLPLPLVALGWVLLLGAEWATDRWRGKVPYRLQQALFFWVLGGGIALGQALPGFWLGLGGGLLAVIGGVLLQIRFERGLRLERQAPQALDVPLPAGGSAWGGEAPERTPEGEAIRLFDGGEIAMGGPLVCHYLMPDGCFIPDCNPSARFSSDGRHFVSPIPSRGAWGLAIFDRQERLLYRCAVDNFWELDSVTEREVIGRHSPLTSNAPQRLELQALKAGSEAEAFVAIGDLWLPESEWQRWSGDLRAQPLPSPLGGPALEIRPCLTYERYGTLGSYSHSSLYLLHARDADDRPRWREADMPRLDLLLPLDGAAGRPGCLLQSAPLADGSRAVWEWLRDDQEAERGAYALRLGDWRLDGEWTLDHRVSDCGRYLAVVAFAEAPTLPQRLAILDSRERRLEWLAEPLADLHLQGFIDGQVHLLHLLGRNAYQPPGGPGEGDPGLLRRFDEGLPEPGAWHAFGRFHYDWRHYYEQARVAFDGTAWRLCPTSRWLDAAPRPWSDGDFVLPSVGAEDAAWGFGFHYEGMHRDEDVRAGFSRDGYLLTASGIGLGNLAAPMIWSADGRYLALTRHVQRYEESDLERDQWRLLLLDVQERTLRRYRDDLGEYPCFDSFDDDLCFRCAGTGRYVLALDSLLKAPAEPLQACAGRWLPAEELPRRRYWERLAFPSRPQ
ncbi:ferredoxin [Pseudomonas aeruginosa]|uniref:ferredoxin n=1 Tax=Pseudomonas aeruginosa TaxID=287 RepID=UPI00157F915E|nr:ferredoxin [Pseudomonas aeruginosa]EKW7238271.1 ferredoxin [Pseudomonas aeruginosa]MBI8833508.1 ferredoxin [Pseudomonas aeruginosa]QKR12935.1 ferredoxin [Pseudomonas aeruginosa]